MSWYDLFSKTILSRGYDYYKDDAVVEFYEDENILSAVVEGSEDYEVSIELNNGDPEYMYCSCPYAADDNNCKHMAAVLFEWEFSKTDSNEMPTAETDISEVVKNAERELVDNFLIKYLSENDELLAEFRMMITQTVSKEDIIIFKRIVDDIFDNNLYNGYISYRNAMDFAMEMESFIYSYIDAMIDSSCIEEAIELINYIYNSLIDIDIDDSGGETGIIGDAFRKMWQKITDKADMQLKKRLFDYFINILNKNSVFYFGDVIEGFLFDNFNEKEFLEKEIMFINKKINAAQKSGDEHLRKYELEKWHLKAIDVYKKQGMDSKFIEDYCKSNWFLPDLRQYYIDKCLENNEYEKAAGALEESIEMDKMYPGLVNDYMLKLKDIYKKCGKKEKYIGILWDIVTKTSAGDMDNYRELKLLYSEKEWETEREKVFSAVEKGTYLGWLYAEEKLYDRLLKYVVNSQGLCEIKKYTKILKDKYPEELLKKYNYELDKMTDRASNRQTYNEIAHILTSLLKIKGGNDYVKNKIKTYKSLYPRRKAMIEELGAVTTK